MATIENILNHHEMEHNMIKIGPYFVLSYLISEWKLKHSSLVFKWVSLEGGGRSVGCTSLGGSAIRRLRM